jgi:hypothetical protein
VFFIACFSVSNDNIGFVSVRPRCSQYTEWLVLGSAAARVEGKLLYDAKTGLFTNNKDANKYLDMTYRKGWEVKL